MIKKLLKHALVILMSWVWVFLFFCRYWFQSKDQEPELVDGITLVITSCNRPEKLDETLRSFFKYNTYPIDKAIFIEDGGSRQAIDIAKVHLTHLPAEFILNNSNIGQLNSIDIAYRKVRTKWIFHLEDDWIFSDGGFIELSKEVLIKYPNVVYLSLRHCKDQNGGSLVKFNDSWLTYKPFQKGVLVGFGFNPSLRRTSDYLLIGRKFGGWNRRETSIGLFYFLLGKKSLVIPSGKYYVSHIGWGCSTVTHYMKC